MEDDCTMNGNFNVDNIHGGASNSDRDFMRFLEKAEKRPHEAATSLVRGNNEGCQDLCRGRLCKHVRQSASLAK
jgi:hypothetical protein